MTCSLLRKIVWEAWPCARRCNRRLPEESERAPVSPSRNTSRETSNLFEDCTKSTCILQSFNMWKAVSPPRTQKVWPGVVVLDPNTSDQASVREPYLHPGSSLQWLDWGLIRTGIPRGWNPWKWQVPIEYQRYKYSVLKLHVSTRMSFFHFPFVSHTTAVELHPKVVEQESNAFKMLRHCRALGLLCT